METNIINTNATVLASALAAFPQYFTDGGSKIVPLAPNYPTIEGFSALELRNRLTAKKEATGAVKAQSKLVFVPAFSLNSEMPQEYASIVRDALESQASIFIKALIEGGSNIVLWDMVDHDSMIQLLSATRESFRLSGEKIALWFDNSPEVAAFLEARTAEKHAANPSIAVAVIHAGTINAWRKECSKLAAPVPGIVESALIKIISMLETAKADATAAAMLVRAKNALADVQTVDAL